MFRGSVAGMSLEEVLSFLSTNGIEGALEVTSGDQAALRLFFRPNGQVFFPFSSRRGTYSLGKILRHTGFLSREGLDRYLSEVRRQRKAVLLNEEVEDDAALEDARRLQFTEEVHDLFLWRDAEFVFRPGGLPPRVAQDLEAGRGLVFDPQSLLFEVARRKDERRRIQQAISSTRLVLRARLEASAAELQIKEALKAVKIDCSHSPFDGRTRLDDLLERWGIPHHEALTAVASLVESGVLLPLPQQDTEARIRTALDEGQLEEAGLLLGHLVECEQAELPKGILIGPDVGVGNRFTLGTEAELIEAPIWSEGPEVRLNLRLGGPRIFSLVGDLLARETPFTAVIYTLGGWLRLAALPGEITLKVSAPRSRGLAHYLSQGQDEALAKLDWIGDELAHTALWTDADLELCNRQEKGRSVEADQAAEVALLSEGREHLVKVLERWLKVFAQAPGDDAMFLPTEKASRAEGARFFMRFTLRQNAGELRRGAKAGPLEFAKVVARAMARGYVRKPSVVELEAVAETARRDGDQIQLYKLARAGLALGYNQAFLPLLREFRRRAPDLGGAPALAGDLDGIGLAAVLQALHDNRRTGTLTVRAGDGERPREERLYFHQGEAYLLRLDDDDQADEFVSFFLGDEGADSVGALGQASPGIVSGEGPVTQAELREIKDSFLDLLLWEDARFTFQQDELPPEFFAKGGQEGARIPLDTRTFLLEAMRSLASWEEVRERIPGPQSVFRFAEGQKMQALASHGRPEILMLIDGQKTFADVVRISGEQQLEVGQLLAGLIGDGLLEPVEASLT